jgi:hypothetical protein
MLGRIERPLVVPQFDADYVHVSLELAVDGQSRPIDVHGGENILDKVLDWCLANDADLSGVPDVVDAIHHQLHEGRLIPFADLSPPALNASGSGNLQFPRALAVFANQRRSLHQSMQKCQGARGMSVFATGCPTKFAVTSLHVSPFLEDNAELLCDAFKELQLDVVCGTLEWCLINVPGCKDRQHIIMSPFSYKAEAWPRELAQIGEYWVYQLEQLSLEKLREVSRYPHTNHVLMNHLILDYSYTNLRILHHFGVQCAFLLPVGTSKSQRNRAATQIQASRIAGGVDWDALMFGSYFKQREEIFGQLNSFGLHAKIFSRKWGPEKASLLLKASVGVNLHGWSSRIVEVTRLMYYGVHGTPSISEDGIDHTLEQELSEAVIFLPRSELVHAIAHLVRSPHLLNMLRLRSLKVAEVRDQAALLTQTLTGLVPSCLLSFARKALLFG